MDKKVLNKVVLRTPPWKNSIFNFTFNIQFIRVQIKWSDLRINWRLCRTVDSDLAPIREVPRSIPGAGSLAFYSRDAAVSAEFLKSTFGTTHLAKHKYPQTPPPHSLKIKCIIYHISDNYVPPPVSSHLTLAELENYARKLNWEIHGMRIWIKVFVFFIIIQFHYTIVGVGELKFLTETLDDWHFVLKDIIK